MDAALAGHLCFEPRHDLFEVCALNDLLLKRIELREVNVLLERHDVGRYVRVIVKELFAFSDVHLLDLGDIL